ncbi:MAG: DMT family transporter, partial [Bacteroidia bacterium]|nr:DMT family transporter [Bacteroidia bacterium]
MKINRSFLELNLAIIFLSTSGVFGRPILMTPTLTIWWRCAIAMTIMLGFVKWMKYDLKIKRRSHYSIIFISSFLLAAHWVSYFYSLSLSNIAIALITLHTFPAMTAILEPIILKTKFKLYHIGLSLMIIAGLYIILPKGEENQHIIPGIIAGLISALTYALRNIYTRKVITDYNGSVMMLYQLIIMTILLVPFLFIESNATFHIDWPYILGVAILTTCLGHTLFVQNL